MPNLTYSTRGIDIWWLYGRTYLYVQKIARKAYQCDYAKQSIIEVDIDEVLKPRNKS